MVELGAQDSITFGKMLREHRLAAGKSLAQVAAEVGTRRQTIADLEKGKNVGVHVAFAALAATGRMVKIYKPRKPTLDEIRELLPEDSMSTNEPVRHMKLTSRENEALMLARCVAVARANGEAANDQREANVFRVASMVMGKHYPAEAGRLRAASSSYFGKHPGDKLLAGAVVNKGWVLGLPRLRDMLGRELARG